MPRGKYRDWCLDLIPTDYLRWVLGHCKNARSAVLSAIECELQRRAEVDKAWSDFWNNPPAKRLPSVDWHGKLIACFRHVGSGRN